MKKQGKKLMNKKHQKRFWNRVAIPANDPVNGCWIWCKAKPVNGRKKKCTGYGSFRFDGKRRAAHQIALMLTKGVVERPKGMDVLHNCDTPACVNPLHLRFGTNEENVRDRVQRGRNGDTKGEKHHSAKVTAKDVLAIRKDKRPLAEIAAQYGISKGAAGCIRNRHTWGWVKDPEEAHNQDSELRPTQAAAQC